MEYNPMHYFKKAYSTTGKVLRGTILTILGLAALKDIDGYNERRFEENKGRQVDRILSDFHALRLQLEEWLGEFSDRELNDPDRFKWSNGHPLWNLVEGNSFGHELQHLTDIERFSSQRLSSKR